MNPRTHFLRRALLVPLGFLLVLALTMAVAGGQSASAQSAQIQVGEITVVGSSVDTLLLGEEEAGSLRIDVSHRNYFGL